MRIIGHRGTPSCPAHPENTLPAVRAALRGGADGVEVDVRATADGVLVLSHDADLGRVLGTGPGTGPAVAGSTWAALRVLALPGGAHVSRLDAVLDLAAASGGLVVTEVKPGDGDDRLRTARLLAELLCARKATRTTPDAVVTSSFDAYSALLLVGCAAQGSALIVRDELDPRLVAPQAQDRGLTELHLQRGHVERDPAMVADLHRLGLRVAAGTEDPEVADWLAGVGVDLLCTDAPAQLAGARRQAPAREAAARRRAAA